MTGLFKFIFPVIRHIIKALFRRCKTVFRNCITFHSFYRGVTYFTWGAYFMVNNACQVTTLNSCPLKLKSS